MKPKRKMIKVFALAVAASAAGTVGTIWAIKEFSDPAPTVWEGQRSGYKKTKNHENDK